MRKARDDTQYQAPLMSAFREAFEARDAKDNSVRIVDGERVIEGRHSRQRRGDEPALKRDLSIELVALLNTINLASAVELDELGYVRDSILLPRKDVVAGFEPVMPSFAGQVSEEDIQALVAYLQSTGDGTGGTR